MLDAIRRAKDEGLIQCVGFTGHDTPENFVKCIETGLFDSITVPYNLINRSYEPTIKRAGELGVGVVAMCPVAGGVLAGESGRLQEALRMDMPTTEMALRFVLANPDVSTACSGMNTMEQLEQNARTVRGFDPAAEGDFDAMCEGLDRLRAELGDEVLHRLPLLHALPGGRGHPAPHGALPAVAGLRAGGGRPRRPPSPARGQEPGPVHPLRRLPPKPAPTTSIVPAMLDELARLAQD